MICSMEIDRSGVTADHVSNMAKNDRKMRYSLAIALCLAHVVFVFLCLIACRYNTVLFQIIHFGGSPVFEPYGELFNTAGSFLLWLVIFFLFLFWDVRKGIIGIVSLLLLLVISVPVREYFPHEKAVQLIAEIQSITGSGNSFPQLKETVIFTVMTLCIYWWRAKAIIFLPAAIVIGLSQLYHHNLLPLDFVLSMYIGIIAAGTAHSIVSGVTVFCIRYRHTLLPLAIAIICTFHLSGQAVQFW